MPAVDDLRNRSAFGHVLIHIQHRVVVVRHDGVPCKINGRDLGQGMEFVFYPLTTMFIAFTRVRILATLKSPADTARHTVVIGGGIQRDLGTA